MFCVFPPPPRGNSVNSIHNSQPCAFKGKKSSISLLPETVYTSAELKAVLNIKFFSKHWRPFKATVSKGMRKRKEHDSWLPFKIYFLYINFASFFFLSLGFYHLIFMFPRASTSGSSTNFFPGISIKSRHPHDI